MHRIARARDVRKDSHRQPRRDRPARASRVQGDGHRTPSRSHSEADANAMHVRLADESVCIGPAVGGEKLSHISRRSSPPLKSQARRRSIPATASCPKTRASPRSSEAHNMVFIGPKPEHIRMMGDKITAKKAREGCGHPNCAGLRRRRDRRRRRAQGRQADRLSGPDQGGGRRRRTRHEGRPFAPKTCLERRALDGAQRSARGVRRRCRLHREISRQTAPYRDPGRRRQPRQCRASGRARLLAPAPPPEGARRGALAGAQLPKHAPISAKSSSTR
jgi:hypothetical protein